MNAETYTTYKGKRMNGAHAVIAALECLDVDLVFGYPGGQALLMYDALYDSPISHVLSRHEQAAVHEADGYARSTGKVGVVMVTSGPGATNTVTGIATAYMDSSPVVVITGQVSSEVIGTDSFQESDIYGITMPVVKHSYLLKSADEIGRVLAEAFYIASTGRKGPVLIDVPSDVAEQLCSFTMPETVFLASYRPTYKGNARQIKAALSEIAVSKRPVILAGGGIGLSGAEGALARFVEKTHIPVVHTLMGKGAYDSSLPGYVGMAGIHGCKAANLALNESDLIIACGTRFSDRVTGRIDKFAPQARLVHIDIDPAEIGKVCEAHVPIVGDVGLVLDDMVARLEGKAVPYFASWNQRIHAWKERYPLFDAAAGDGLVPEDVLARLSALLEGTDAIVSTEVGQHQMWAAQAIQRPSKRQFITSGGLGTMGFGLPAAIGAACANPGVSVVCVAGDGSLQMNIQEMAVASVNRLPVKVVLMNNRCLGMVHELQEFSCKGRYSNTELPDVPDFCLIAQAYGWQSSRLTDTDGIDAALEEMLASPGPYLLDVRINRECNVYPISIPGTPVIESYGAIDLQLDGCRERLD